METPIERAFDPHTFLSHVSTLPGVYQMRDQQGKMLYVGKARDLRKRLSSYFRPPLAPKTALLMEQVFDIQTTITQSETEALILESNLIKSHRPKYNILLRDDKSYPYIHLSAHEFPRLALHRGARAGGEYFGPFPSSESVRETLNILQKIFRVRQCSDTFFRSRSRPCLQYQIERCYAPCVALISAQDYAQSVAHTRDFLSGRSQALTELLSKEMEAAAAALQYERAAVLRDQLVQLRKVTETQHISVGSGDCDVLATVCRYGQACVQLMFVRDGRNIGSRAYHPRLPEELPESDVLQAFMAQFYMQHTPPAELLLSHQPSEAALLEDFLSQRAGHAVKWICAPRGERAKWLQMAERNAAENLSIRLAGQMAMQQRFAEFAQAFDIDVPQRIECIDISHTQGTNPVGSCVVFDQHGAQRQAYRHYNIRGVQAGDDYAAIAQVIERRFARLIDEEAVLPDVMLVDGGKGQLKRALTVLEELGVSGVLLIGVSKGMGRKAGLEQFWLPEEHVPRHLPADSQAMQLIVQLRDEAHRFAITGHRARRAKAAKHSVLEGIPQVGPKRRRALLKYFGGLHLLREASTEDIARVPGISHALALQIYTTLHEKG